MGNYGRNFDDYDVDARPADYGPAIDKGPGRHTQWVPAPTTRPAPVRVVAEPAVHLSTAFESRGVAGDSDGARGRAFLFLTRGFVVFVVFFVIMAALTLLAAFYGVMAWDMSLPVWALGLAAVGTLVVLGVMVTLDYSHSPAGVERYRIQRAADMGEEQIRLQADLYARAIEGQLDLLRRGDK